MKILFTGGGTGGHFYPIIAVAEAVHDIVRKEKYVEPELYYAAPDPYDRDMLVANHILFVPTAAGKLRNYFSLLNFIDAIKTTWGTIRSVFRIFFLYPDVVFGKGGYVSFPTLLAAKLFRIPVIIHESDAVPGRVNRWAGKFAVKVAVSYEEAAKYFPADKVQHTGNPVRKALEHVLEQGAYEFLHLENDVPVILMLGGSQGSTALNDALLDALPLLVDKYQIIHQTGRANINEVTGRAKVVLLNNEYASRYHPFDYLGDLALRMAAGATSIVISRAGSTIFEIAKWGKPSILVPLPESAGDHQAKNAYAYARTGASVVIEQSNFTANILASEINRIIGNPKLSATMGEAGKRFAKDDAASIIAKELIDICVSHDTE